jgi:O-antigen/teichoic acid export membrane protein
MEIKLFGKNTLIYAIGNVCLRASSFLILPLYTHFLTMEEFGLLVTLLLTIQVFTTIMGLGTGRALMRFTATYQKSERMGELLACCLFLNVLAGILVSLIVLVFFEPLFRSILHTEKVEAFLMLSCLTAAAQSLFLNTISYYRAKNDGLRYVIYAVAGSVLLIVLVFYNLVMLHSGIKGVLIAQIISYGSLWLIVSAIIFKNIGIKISFVTSKTILYFGFPLVFAMSGDLVTETSAVYLLSYFTSLKQVAIYSLGYKIAQIASIVLIYPFELTFEPYLFSSLDRPNTANNVSKILTYFVLIYSCIAIGIAYMSRGLLWIMAPVEYNPAGMVVFLLLPGIAFSGIQFIGQSLLHIKKKTMVTATTITFFTILSVVLQYLLIPQWGIYSVVLIFNFTVVSIAVVLMILGMKDFPLMLEKQRLFITAVLFGCSIFLIFLLRNIPGYLYYSLIPLAVFSGYFLLYLSDFLHTPEKENIRAIFERIVVKSN